MEKVKAFQRGTGWSGDWQEGGRDEGIFDCVLFCGNHNSLLVCAAVFPDSWAEFQALFRRGLWDTDFELFCSGLDCGIGDFPRMVASRCSRETDRWLVDCGALESGGGIIAGAAVVLVETIGRDKVNRAQV
jgi:hypothetical protein